MRNQVVSSIFESLKGRSEKVGFRSKDLETNNWEDFNWGKVESKIRQIAYALLKNGVKHQDKVAIFSQNMMDWVLTDVAVMSIGGVSVPIYATNTANQAKYVLNDADIDLMFVGEREQYEKAIEIFNAGDTKLKKIIVFDNNLESKEEFTQHISEFIDVVVTDELKDEFEERFLNVSRDDLASLIYTSGTTGEPKGVMLTHNNFISSFEMHDEFLDSIQEDDHSLCFLPLSHVFERTWTLYCMHRGVKVSFLSDPKLIIDTLQEVKPTMFCTVPRIYEKVYAAIQTGLETASKTKRKVFGWSVKQGRIYHDLVNREQKIPRQVKVRKKLADKLVLNKIKNVLGGNLIISPTAGAPLSAEIQAFMRSVGIPIVMGYGLTESTATVTAFPNHHYKIGSAGKVLNGIEIKIGNNDEILVKAPTIMKGYYNKPEATAEVFEGEWFKTGDAGRIEDDGSLFITDRIKDLMKTAGGKYIAPQQIEALLTDDSFIEQAMVIGDERPYVTAFVVPNFEALKDYAKLLEIKYLNMEELISNSKIKEFYDKKVSELQKELAGFEKIKKFKLMHKEFSMEKGELTPTLKIRRKIIVKKFQHFIHDLYGTKEKKDLNK
jgi:long-chain acyl-CoA synthetase